MAKGGKSARADAQDGIMEKIISKSGKAQADIEAMVEGKKTKFSGLLTESGALFMVARELGVELEVEKGEPAAVAKIAGLDDGMQNVDLIVRAMQISTPREFEKGGKKGVLCNLLVADDSGDIRLTLWHGDVKKLRELNVQRGAILSLKGCRVSAYKERKQVDVGYGGSFSVLGSTSEKLPEPCAKECWLAELKAGEQNVDVYARVARIYGEREFEKDGRGGKVLNFEIADEGAAIRAAAWNEIADVVKGLDEGELVKIEGAYAKEGLRGVELNLGWQARVLRGVKKEMKPLSELPGIERAKAEKKEISELQEGGNFEIKAKIAELQQGNLKYNICPKCGKKVESVSGGWVCNACGEVDKPDINPLIGFTAQDRSGKIRGVAFGTAAEKIMGIEKEELKRRLAKEDSVHILEEIAKAREGDELTLRGRAKANTMSGEIEFVVNEVAGDKE
ncbi:MAG: hypothetical protein ABH854_03605 [Candidatus Diapherotrites archaeon]